MNRRGLMNSKNVLVGQYALWKVVNVTKYKNYSTATDFRNDQLSALINSHNNISIICDFQNNTENERAGIDYTITMFKKNGITTFVDSGHRVGGRFADSYGANIYAGSQIYIYYAVLDSELGGV